MLNDEFIGDASSTSSDIILFSVVRNEILRIYAWLEHYRKIGVKQIAIIDNYSSDGTYEFLLNQPDVTITRINESFRESNFGIKWLNEFISKIDNKWILFADADELLVFKGYPRKDISQLCFEAKSMGKNAIFAVMLDMYPDCSLENLSKDCVDDLLEAAPCFDGDYFFRQSPIKPWSKEKPKLEIIGGPRLRLLSSFEKECNTTWQDYFIRGQIDRLVPWTPTSLLPWLIRIMPKQMPSLSKVPLVLSGQNLKYCTNHDVYGANFYPENAVFLHFKFLRDFSDRVKIEIDRGEHFRFGAEYIMYNDLLTKFNCLDFRYKNTKKFTNVDQLIELNIIRDIRKFYE